MKAVAELNHWLMTKGRCSGDPVAVVSHFCDSLIEAGVPLWRVNIGQRFANPLLAAWGVVWRQGDTESYHVPHTQMVTDSYIGSAFDYVLTHQRPLHKSLRGLDPAKDHISFIEFAEAGGTDYYATLLDYGDGSQHGCTFATQDPDGFTAEHLEMIEAVKTGLSCALEPITMRKSAQSLLRTYLGDGPSKAVWNGTIKRGERQTLEAVVLFSDLRGFTALSENLAEDDILAVLDDYFEAVVQSVEENGGDVLKFMGDGILSVFVIASESERSARCRQATLAAKGVVEKLATLNDMPAKRGQAKLDVGIGINLGKVSYGNIGSPGRLDFTVLGSAVNIASRIEGLTKSVGVGVLATAAIAELVPDLFASCGSHEVRGLNHPLEVYGLLEDPNHP